MPFSRSRSVESMTRSATAWFSRKAPDCQSIASTRVVLPWSTWATMATLRRSSRAGTTGHGTPAVEGRTPPCGGHAPGAGSSQVLPHVSSWTRLRQGRRAFASAGRSPVGNSGG